MENIPRWVPPLVYLGILTLGILTVGWLRWLVANESSLAKVSLGRMATEVTISFSLLLVVLILLTFLPLTGLKANIEELLWFTVNPIAATVVVAGLLKLIYRKGWRETIGLSVSGLIIVGLAFMFIPLWVGEVGEGLRARLSKANGDRRQLATALQDHLAAYKSYPVPEDAQGMPLTGTQPEIAGPVGTPTVDLQLYYRGPSYVPQALGDGRVMAGMPEDPFRPEARGRLYGYGIGPGTGEAACYILTSYGPDGKSEAEELENLWIDELRGSRDLQRTNPDFLNHSYSPTNGARSRGDLWVVGPVKTTAFGNVGN